MKVAYVVPRYGERVFGGAENACRLIAEHLAADTGWGVQVITSTATDSVTWAPELSAGTTVENGVTVHRFEARPRDPAFAAFSEEVLGGDPRAVSNERQLRWVELQGPTSGALIDAVRTVDADVVCFTPYLFHPTVVGLPVAPAPAVFHPAMHDEPPAHLPMIGKLFTAAAGLVFYSHPERLVSEQLYPVATSRQIVLGIGVDQGGGDPLAFRQRFGLGERPYLVYVGRVDSSKGVIGLSRLFAAYKEANPGPLALVLAGQVAEQPVDHPDIVLPGLVDEETKWAALRGALALVSPSRYESFSLLLMEGWLADLPALVNATCPVTSDHVRRSRGGFTFGSYLDFESAVEVLLRDGQARRTLAAAGKHYVESRFRWPVVIDRYATFLEQVARG